MTEHAEDERLGRALAALLWFGTWAASALIAIGIGVEAIQRVPDMSTSALAGYAIVKAGVALLIMLPAARVLMLFAVFVYRRDRIYALIAACILAILGAGVVIGLYT
ncbi:MULTISPECIES: DUF1634 domain-containing protein [unclassified Rhizobium]|jgi:hypothetical protein|uniref:DUF1634 domain-containing protein n=1 Tax=unclassified Rhizobium TaxID=2613769 RepID=UPI0006467BA9|nr:MULTISPECIES: DUF1634 domain-containing protein [unclassified Rhizobium]MBN8954602.1 DUF1634 domain-containing protein [Rhizobium tropici]OJY68046.1 MAG: hypothetical protein BGP09_27730 [Rhizobium sp. 60-20]RKD40494.1 uncharacterized protein DUF1634 [Rhizobium sp. WW_1]